MNEFGPETFGKLYADTYDAGLQRERWAWWDRSPFVADSTSHVSVYGLTP